MRQLGSVTGGSRRSRPGAWVFPARGLAVVALGRVLLGRVVVADCERTVVVPALSAASLSPPSDDVCPAVPFPAGRVLELGVVVGVAGVRLSPAPVGEVGAAVRQAGAEAAVPELAAPDRHSSATAEEPPPPEPFCPTMKAATSAITASAPVISWDLGIGRADPRCVLTSVRPFRAWWR
ncbi:hypothetical protein [Parafrankia sp. EUN1f]|uniref:hypothetical protein n=1 Tax=Parafrankia sp. EUN1f TaxID=102897 RepID=UPI0001C45625|nr:hypothetical protein [Parafrankia sp. EUN1f]EFC83683.1 hypothetical protein FrEUN1fDRAFT_3232 [Parafrankia sp. EUN1f]